MPKPLKYELDGAEIRHGDANVPNLTQICVVLVKNRPKKSFKFNFFSTVHKPILLPNTLQKIIRIVMKMKILLQKVYFSHAGTTPI